MTVVHFLVCRRGLLPPGFFRIIVYLRVHPRVAILYKTVMNAKDEGVEESPETHEGDAADDGTPGGDGEL